MMWLYLLSAYGLAFLVQVKVTSLRGRMALLDELLDCSYCGGFWAGWATWGLSWFIQGEPILKAIPSTGNLGQITAGLTWAFASATFCYSLDTMLRHLEENTP